MLDDDRDGLLALLLQEGNAGQAIELYCDEMGATREEARAAVRELSRRYGIPLRRPALAPWLVLIAAVVLGSALVFQA